MKLYRNISFRILFLFTVLCCYSGNIYPITQMEQLYEAGMACPVSEACSHIADTDPMGDEDHIHAIANSVSSVESLEELPGIHKVFAYAQILFTVWQPPKTI